MKTITPPATEPITEIEFATHERIGDAPTTIAAKVYIRAARQAIETYLRRRLITQTVEFSLAGFGPHIHLPVDPVQSVTSISYTDDPGATQTLPAANYQLVQTCRPNLIAPAYNVTWPVPRSDWQSVTVRLKVGFGDAGSDVPEDILQGLRMLAGHFLENREGVSMATAAEMPWGVKSMLRPYRLWL